MAGQIITLADQIKNGRVEIGQRYLDIREGVMFGVHEIDGETIALGARARHEEYRITVCPNHETLSSRPLSSTGGFRGSLAPYKRHELNLVG